MDLSEYNHIISGTESTLPTFLVNLEGSSKATSFSLKFVIEFIFGPLFTCITEFVGVSQNALEAPSTKGWALYSYGPSGAKVFVHSWHLTKNSLMYHEVNGYFSVQ